MKFYLIISKIAKNINRCSKIPQDKIKSGVIIKVTRLKGIIDRLWIKGIADYIIGRRDAFTGISLNMTEFRWLFLLNIRTKASGIGTVCFTPWRLVVGIKIWQLNR